MGEAGNNGAGGTGDGAGSGDGGTGGAGEGQGGQATPSWVESLSSELQTVVLDKGFKEPSDVLNSYVNLEKLRGVPQDRLLKLPEKSDDPAWNDIYSKLGRPEKPDGYGFNKTEGEDNSFTEWAENTFHELNLTGKQGKALAEKLTEFNQQTLKNQEAAYSQEIEKQESQLKSDWGNKYDQNMAQAQLAVKNLGIDADTIDSMEKAIGFSKTMEFMHNLGVKMGEGSFIEGNPNISGAMTKEQASAKIKQLSGDQEFNNRYLSGEYEAKTEMEKLHKIAAGS